MVKTQGTKLVKVFIASQDPVVRDFLGQIVVMHGYAHAVAVECQDLFQEFSSDCPTVMFIDHSSLFRPFQEKIQCWVDKGVPTVVLGDEKACLKVSQSLNLGFYRKLEKPLDYKRIGQIMADVLSC